MSGRIRSIKPEFLEDEKLGAMGAVTRLLFACTWLMADDYGNFRANPKWVHSQAFCFDEQTSVGAIRDSLAELTGSGMLTLYWVRGQSYYHVTNWSKHQRVDKPGKPHCPGLDEAEVPQIEECRLDSRDCRETPTGTARDSSGTLVPDQDLDQEGKGKDRAGATAPTRIQNTKPDRFGASMSGTGPGTRKDVQELHSAWRTAFGRTGATLRHATGDDAYALAEAIDAHGLPDCLLVASEAPKDGWVSGQLDDKNAKHESIRYIFGTEETFSRILAASKKRGTGPNGGPKKPYAQQYAEHLQKGRLLDE